MFAQIYKSKLLVAVALVSLIAPVQAAKYKVGIAQFGPHPQLDAAVEAFKQELAAQGYTDVEYDYNHINFDPSLVAQMLGKIKAGKPNLILTVTTPVSQGAKTLLKGSGIPAVFAAVTDPVAAKLTPSWDAGDDMMTGASDLQNLDAVLGFTRRLLPNAKRLAVPFNPGEDNDVAALNIMKKLAGKHGFSIVELGIDNANDIQVRIRSLQGKADVIYVSASNLLQPALPAISSAASAIKMPIINSATGPVSEHQVLAAYAVNYSKVGNNAGKLAAKILAGAKPKSLSPLRPLDADHAAKISSKQLKTLGMTLPASFKDCNCLLD